MTRFLLSLFAALALTACVTPFAAWNVQPGATRDQVIAQAGQPARVYPLPNGGQRLQYTAQPMGRFAWNVDLDATGRVVRADQILTQGNFMRIEPDRWTREDVEREFGPPAMVERVSSWNGPVYTYRWQDVMRSDMFYWVYFDAQGVVRRAHPGMDHINSPADRF